MSLESTVFRLEESLLLHIQSGQDLCEQLCTLLEGVALRQAAAASSPFVVSCSPDGNRGSAPSQVQPTTATPDVSRTTVERLAMASVVLGCNKTFLRARTVELQRRLRHVSHVDEKAMLVAVNFSVALSELMEDVHHVLTYRVHSSGTAATHVGAAGSSAISVVRPMVAVGMEGVRTATDERVVVKVGGSQSRQSRKRCDRKPRRCSSGVAAPFSVHVGRTGGDGFDADDLPPGSDGEGALRENSTEPFPLQFCSLKHRPPQHSKRDKNSSSSSSKSDTSDTASASGGDEDVSEAEAQECTDAVAFTAVATGAPIAESVDATASSFPRVSRMGDVLAQRNTPSNEPSEVMIASAPPSANSRLDAVGVPLGRRAPRSHQG